MDTAKEKAVLVKRVFDRIPRVYDLLNRILSLGMDRLWRKALVRAGSITGTSRVLDLCCGTGDMTQMIKRATGAEVWSLDFSAAMVERGRQKGKLSSLSLVADATVLPFRDRSFDIVTVAFGIRNIPDIGKLCEAVQHVLRPGGEFLILELTRPDNRVLRALHYLYVSVWVPLAGGLLSLKFAEYFYLSRSVLTFYAREELAALLRQNGFTRITMVNKGLGAATVFRCRVPG